MNIIMNSRIDQLETNTIVIDQFYEDINGVNHSIDNSVINSLTNILNAQEYKKEFSGILIGLQGQQLLLPPTSLDSKCSEIVIFDETNQQIILPIVHNNGNEFAVFLSEELAIGYYTLSLPDYPQPYRLIITPRTAYQPDGAGKTGLALQLYSLKSQKNWGIGDFVDLADLMPICAKYQIDFIGINPLHALFTSQPSFASPYSPSSRIWLNPIYLNIPLIAQLLNLKLSVSWDNDALEELRSSNLINYTQVWKLKQHALSDLFDEFEQHNQSEFESYLKKHGDQLIGFALFEALDNHFAAPTNMGWLTWDEAYQHPESDAVKKFAEEHQHEIRFYAWLQWLCSEQWQYVQHIAEQHHIQLGIYGDLAVSVAKGGADTWLNRAHYCMDLSIGAPPDAFNPNGQNWQLPPLHPLVLQQTGGELFIQLIRENMKRFGVLRIDHVMALNRLWLIAKQSVTSGNQSSQGAYVRYPQEMLFAILAVESQRNHCVVIGEDLGIVPQSTRELLNRYQISSYKVLYFTSKMQEIPAHAIAVTSTHDLAPLAGYCDLPSF